MTLTTWAETSIGSDATFRTACTNWDTAIKAVGLVNYAQTGEMNYSTVTKPVSTYTKAGFTCYAFNDANQGSYPCYLKVEYGVSNNTSNLALGFTIGTSLDGSGNLGSIKTTTIWLYNPQNSASYSSFCSGSTSRLTLGLNYNVNSSGSNAFISIERIQSSAGADTTTGLVMAWAKNYGGSGVMTNTQSGNGHQVIYFSGTQPTAFYNNNLYMALPLMYQTTTSSTTWSDGHKVYLSGLYPIGLQSYPAMQGFLINYAADIPYATNPVISHFGTNRTWYALGAAAFSQLFTNANMTLLVRWD
jgi:hypothetical protein